MLEQELADSEHTHQLRSVFCYFPCSRWTHTGPLTQDPQADDVESILSVCVDGHGVVCFSQCDLDLCVVESHMISMPAICC